MRSKAVEKDFYKYFDDERIKLIAEIQTRTGLRLSDVLALTPKALKRQPTITEKKTGKSRRIYICDSLRKKLNARVEYFGLSDTDYIFANEPGGKPPHRSTVWRKYKELGRYVYGNSEKISPHSTRKTYAKKYIKNSSLEALQKKLGHDSASTTMIYVFDEPTTQRKKGKKKP